MMMILDPSMLSLSIHQILMLLCVSKKNNFSIVVCCRCSCFSFKTNTIYRAAALSPAFKNIYIFCLLLNKKNENLIFLKTKIELPAHFWWWNNTTFSNTFNSGIQHLNIVVIVVDFCLFLNEKTKLTRNN